MSDSDNRGVDPIRAGWKWVLKWRAALIGVVALVALPSCSEFNGDRYALAKSATGHVVVLACAEADLADVEVWLLDDDKIVGDDGDELLALLDDEWLADGEVFALQTGVSWDRDVGVGVSPSKNAPFAARLKSAPGDDEVSNFARGDVRSREAFTASC